jgi:Stealth protein CR2, conserved region 2/Stealth protein CR1, conserved region 1/Stealth protein CR3, conserved region 3/Stealth protein CR4, conserved region 4
MKSIVLNEVLECLAQHNISTLGAPVIEDFNSFVFLPSEAASTMRSVWKALLRRGFSLIFTTADGKRKRYVSELMLSLLGPKNIVAVKCYPNNKKRLPKTRFASRYGCNIRFLLMQENNWWQAVNGDTEFPPMAHAVEYNSNAFKYQRPVDVVYTWVDGTDELWRQRKSKFINDGLGLSELADSRARYESRNELLYSIRSVVRYMPWVRNIYVVTDRQVPSWFASTSRITIVDHSELFPDKSCLPVFNSHAIESVLHRIEGLSDIFVYFNDDLFVNQPIQIGELVSPGGVIRNFLSRHKVPVGPPSDRQVASEWGAINSARQLASLGSFVAPYKLKHTPHVLSRIAMAELEKNLAVEFKKIRTMRFRSSEDIAPVFLGIYYAIWQGRAVAAQTNYRYLQTSSRIFAKKLRSLKKSTTVKFFCLNDNLPDDAQNWDEVGGLMKEYLELLFPDKSECEIKDGID